MDQMMTRAQYAAHHGKSDRTVQRWLERQLLPGATLTREGWRIPADVLPLLDDPTPRSVATTPRGPASPPLATLTGLLDARPAYLDVETAAQLLGITPYAVRQRLKRYKAEQVGDNGAWMIPQSVVRKVAGLR